MHKWLNTLIILTASLAVVLSLATAPSSGQAQASRLPRSSDGYPLLSGIWQTMSSAHWDLEDHAARQGPLVALGAAYSVPEGVGVVEGGTIPYRPEALARKKENYAKSLKLLEGLAKQGNVGPRFAEEDYKVIDPEIPCYLPGVPRATYMPYPFQIVQSTATVLLSYEYNNASRIVYMNSTEEAPVDSWMGWSRGRWDGETLVIDVTALREETWFDRAGNFHSDELHVIERYTPKGADHLAYEATIEDPKIFTRPWKISLPLYRRVETHAQLGEYLCVEFAEELMYGQYTKRASK
jgi:hypothetical protein